MKCWAIALAGMILASAAIGAPGGALGPATQGAGDARWAGVVERLGSAEFAAREAAQKELEKSTWRDVEALERIAGGSGDAEIKTRLAGRVEALREEMAWNPPPISVRLEKANRTETAAALSKALGLPMEVWPPERKELFVRQDVFTVNAVEKPFWEVLLELSAQHPLCLNDIEGLRLVNSSEPWRRGTVVGPVAVFPQRIVRERIADLGRSCPVDS
jgi:hypothetical protein